MAWPRRNPSLSSRRTVWPEERLIRSTRATAAVARLNRRAEGHRYLLVVTSSGLFTLREQLESGLVELTAPLDLDAFVRFVDAQGPQKPQRISKYDAAFAKQLVKKTS